MTAIQITQSCTTRVLKAFDAEFSRRVLAMVSTSSAPAKLTTTAPKSVIVSVSSARQSPTRVVRRDAPAVTRSRSLPVPLYMINEAEYVRQFGY
jgi:hypothetical protein